MPSSSSECHGANVIPHADGQLTDLGDHLPVGVTATFNKLHRRLAMKRKGDLQHAQSNQPMMMKEPLPERTAREYINRIRNSLREIEQEQRPLVGVSLPIDLRD